MCAIGGGKRTGSTNDIRNQHRGIETHAQSTIFLRNGDAKQAQVSRLFEKRRHQLRVLHAVNGFYVGIDLRLNKILTGLSHHFLLFTEFLRNKNILCWGFSHKKLSALDAVGLC